MGDPGGYVRIGRRYDASRLAVGGRRENRFLRRLPAAYRLLLAALLLISSAASAADTLPFIEDDYAKAVTRAQVKNLPIFVEAWAPW